MTKKLTERVAKLEAEVAALQGMLISFMIASRRAERLVSTATMELVETYGDDAEDAGHHAIAAETRHLLAALARLQSGEDAEVRD